MIELYPGSGLGRVDRTRLAFTLGWHPVGSLLTPVQVVSQEVAFHVRQTVIDDVVSEEELFLVTSQTRLPVASSLPSDSVIGEQSDGTVRSEEPPDTVKSEEPDGEE